jgi:hypothetical protein
VEKIKTAGSIRVSFLPHSFFQDQPQEVADADVFFLRHILHDWPDAECLTILRNLTKCLKPSAKIILAEQLMPAVGEVPMSTERVMRALDMQMMVQFGSTERTLEDWKDLFRRADHRLILKGVTKPAGSADSFLELQMQPALTVEAAKSSL